MCLREFGDATTVHKVLPVLRRVSRPSMSLAVVALCLLMGGFIVQKPTFMRQAAADRLSSLRQAAADVVQSRSSCQQVDASNTQELIISEACQQRRMALCLEDSQADSEITAYSAKNFKSGRKPRLKLEAVLSSQLPRQVTAVTYLTTLSLDRRGMIAGLCMSYGSVISLAVYVPRVAGNPGSLQFGVSNVIPLIQEQFDDMEERGACQLDIMIFSEKVATNQLAKELYPENALRNMALLAAKTELVLIGDVDLLAGSELRDAVSDARRYNNLLRLTAERMMVIVPTVLGLDVELAPCSIRKQAGPSEPARQQHSPP
jgi:hypothetical protein